MFSIALLFGCNDRVDKDLSLPGESESWSLEGYEIIITNDDFKAGNGLLKKKNENEDAADWFEMITHVVINGKDTVVHHHIEEGPVTDLAEKPTGAIEGPANPNEKRRPITIEEIDEIYMVVKWNKKMEEMINLLQKQERGFIFELIEFY